MATTVTRVASYYMHGKNVDLYTVSIPAADVGALAAVTGVNIDSTITGLTTSDHVVASYDISTDARIVLQAASVSATDTLRLRFVNPSAAAGTSEARVAKVMVFHN